MSQGQRKGLPEPVIRFFEETADGNRREIQDEAAEDARDNAFLESLQSTIRNLEKRVGKRTSTLETPDVGKRDLEDGQGDHEWGSPNRSEEDTFTENINTKIEELEADMQRLERVSQLENLSEEDRLKIREEMFNFDTDGMNLHSPWKTLTDVNQSRCNPVIYRKTSSTSRYTAGLKHETRRTGPNNDSRIGLKSHSNPCGSISSHSNRSGSIPKRDQKTFINFEQVFTASISDRSHES